MNRKTTTRWLVACLVLILAASAAPGSQLAPRVEARVRKTPDIPVVVDELYFGVPAGNGFSPYRVAVDGQGRRAFSLNMGRSEGGNTISVVDLETYQVEALIQMDNPGEFGPPSPLDIQVDPYRPRLYAITGDRYADTPQSVLTIFDKQTLDVIDSLEGVEAVAPGPETLYLVNDNFLWSVDPDTFEPLSQQEIPTYQYNDFLVLNPSAGRLYVGRGRPWFVATYDSASLASIDDYEVSGDLLQLVVQPEGKQAFLVERDDTQARLVALDVDGAALKKPAPVTLDHDSYDFPLAAGRDSLYVVDGDWENLKLRGFELPDMEPLPELSMSRKPNDMVIDDKTGYLQAVYTNPDGPLQILDPTSGVVANVFTAINVVDALANPDAQRLYVLDEAGTLSVLDLEDYTLLERVATGYSVFDDASYYGSVRLSLDAGRNRLYIDGDPVRSLDTNSLEMTTYPSLAGRITANSGSDRVFLTTPCQCRVEVCNTLVLDADTMTGSQALFSDPDPLTAPCVSYTQLDQENQLLYAQIYNGVPGSNSGNYFTVFDVSGAPKEIYTDSSISYGRPALDPPGRGMYVSRYRMDASRLLHFVARDDSFTQAGELLSAQGQPAYDYLNQRLYVVDTNALMVLDADLTLLNEVGLPEYYDLLDFDIPGQRLYLKGNDGQLVVVATSGGQPDKPIQAAVGAGVVTLQKIVPVTDDLIFRIFNGQAYRSEDGGRTWQLLGLGLPARDINDLAVSPDFQRDQTVLVGLREGSAGGGLYRSTDGGDTWNTTNAGLTNLAVNEIDFSPTFARDGTLYVATTGRGLYKSTDGGDSWADLSSRYAEDEYSASVSHVALSPAYADDGLVFISRGWSDLLRSTDGGDTWADTGAPSGLVAFSPDFARDGLVINGGNWRSTDGGLTWEPSAVGLEPDDYGAAGFHFSPNFTSDQTIYVLIGYFAPLRLQRSVDGGQTWQSLAGGLPSGFEIAAGAVLPGGSLCLSETSGQVTVISPDQLEWQAEDVTAADVSRLEIQSMTVGPDGSVYIANGRDGIFKSVDQGTTWTRLNFPVQTSASSVIHMAVAGDGTLFAGLDAAIQRSPDGGLTWENLPGIPRDFQVSSLAVSPNYSEDNTLVAGSSWDNRQIIRSTDGGRTWQVVFDGANIEGSSELSSAAFSPDFAADGTIYAWLQYAGLVVSTDGGNEWGLAGSDQEDFYGQTLTTSPDGTRLYLGALYGHLLESRDRGKTWTDLRDNIPDERTWSTALVFDDRATMFLATDRGIYRSLDMGQTWAPVNAGLPLNPDTGVPREVRALVAHGDLLYAAPSENGVFISNDGGDTWVNAASGEPASDVQTLPTPVPVPTTTPIVQPTPTTVSISSPSDCSTPPDYFRPLWEEQFTRLGCPVASYQLPMVEQSFERGRMFWRSDNSLIYVLPDQQPFARFEDTWNEDQPLYACPDSSPSETPPTPLRGFGKVWCNADLPPVRELLGNAVSEERLFDATLQEFDTGLVFETDERAIYVLEIGQNTSQRFE